jgi:tetratricopeptide (TPR) repeat protein
MLADENERAVGLGRPALTLAEKLGRDDMRAHVLNNIGVARASLGEEAGLDDLEASREIARGIGGPEYLRACANLASVLTIRGQLHRAAELHREALHVAQDIGYEEPTRWLSTEVAIDRMLAGDWKEARRIVDELIPGYEKSPFWIEPQTRVCRARMLVAEGAVDEAVVDAERAVELVRGSSVFQGLCSPLAFRARLHAELGEREDAARLVDEVLAAWTETRSGYIDIWMLDAWFTAWSLGEESQLESMIEEVTVIFPWLEVATSLIERDFGAAAATLEGMGAVAPAAEVWLRAGEWLVEQRRPADAAVHLDRAASFFRSVGAGGYLRRCESLLSAAS